MARRVLMAQVSEGRVRGIPRLGWIYGVKVALGNRGRTWRLRDNARKVGKSGEPCVLLDRPPVPWWLLPGEGRDAVT